MMIMIPDCISDCCFWISHYGGRLGFGGIGSAYPLGAGDMAI